jgi:lauroyl/myristoyl acyltransferase
VRHRPKHIAEYVALVTIASLIRALPFRAALAIGWVVAAGTHFIGRINVERTHERIREVCGDACPKRKIRRIAWTSWRNLFFNGIEALRFSKLTLEDIRSQPMAVIEPEIKRMVADSQEGFILATPHMGNWEIAGVSADLIGVPLFVVARKQKNPLIDGYINKMRGTFGLEVIFKEAREWKGIIDRIKTGHVMAILPDIGVRAKGVTVPFMNGQATIAPGAARFSHLADCPIYPVVMRRVGWTQHACVILKPIRPDASVDKDTDHFRIMEEVMGALSEEILKTPEQYFWYNKRWVLKPQ